jgi:hypothetical protein
MINICTSSLQQQERNCTQPFFMLTAGVRNRLLETNLTAAEWRIWCYLVSLDPFGDRGVAFSVSELMLRCRVKKSTYFAAKAKLQKLGLVYFQESTIKAFNLQGRFHSAKNSPNYSQQDQFIESNISEYSQQPQLIDSKILELDSKEMVPNPKFPHHCCEISEFQDSEPLLEKDCSSLQTIKNFQTNQTEAGDEKNQEQSPPLKPVNEQPEKASEENNTQILSSQPDFSNPPERTRETKESTAPPSTINIQKSTPRGENDSHIPADLKAKLEELSIPLDGRVRKAIASHDLSQAYGAVAHIERTWETIDNPRGVFLFQITRQPVEPLGARGAVRQASEFGWTLEFVKRMYPDNWQEAAQHFGLEVQVS